MRQDIKENVIGLTVRRVKELQDKTRELMEDQF